ncbi:MAG: hypothetical protein HPY71_14320 [Firmicutes bacterium]|nr:hypothetical protein [Bacillota bacterium]
MKVITYEGQTIEGTPEEIVQRLADTSRGDAGMSGEEYMQAVKQRIKNAYGVTEKTKDAREFLHLLVKYEILKFVEGE